MSPTSVVHVHVKYQLSVYRIYSRKVGLHELTTSPYVRSNDEYVSIVFINTHVVSGGHLTRTGALCACIGAACSVSPSPSSSSIASLILQLHCHISSEKPTGGRFILSRASLIGIRAPQNNSPVSQENLPPGNCMYRGGSFS